MDDSGKTRIRTLLNYWIEHNKEHSDEVLEWAKKARALGEDETGEQMLKAAQEMDKANELLAQALEKLK